MIDKIKIRGHSLMLHIVFTLMFSYLLSSKWGFLIIRPAYIEIAFLYAKIPYILMFPVRSSAVQVQQQRDTAIS